MSVDVKFRKGLESQLATATKIEGTYYQCTDTGRLYLCIKNASDALEFVEVGNLIHDENGETTSLKTRQGENNASWGHDSTIISSTESSAIGDRSSIISSSSSSVKNNTNDASIIASKGSSIYVPNSPLVEKYSTRSKFPDTGATDTFYIAEDTKKIYRYNNGVYFETTDKAYESWNPTTGHSAIIASENSKVNGINYSNGHHKGTNTAIIASKGSEMKGINSAIIGGYDNLVQHDNCIILGGENIYTDWDNRVYTNNMVFVGDYDNGDTHVVRRAVVQAGTNITDGNTHYFNFPNTGGTLVVESELSQIRSDIGSAQGKADSAYNYADNAYSYAGSAASTAGLAMSAITTHTGDSHIDTAQTSGLYKISVSNQGHITGVTAVQKTDITSLGIPGESTTYSDATTTTHGLLSASDKTKLDGIAAGADSIEVSQTVTEGTEIAEITINGGTPTKLYVPTDADTTYTFTSGTNGFTVTPSRGTATNVTVTPSIANNALTTSTISGTVSGSNVTTAGTVGGTVASPTVTVTKKTVTDALGYTPLQTQTQADWNQTTTTAADYIKNKPTIPDEVTESTVSGWGFTKNAGTVTSVKVGTASYTPTSGVVSLPAYPAAVTETTVSGWGFTKNAGTVTSVAVKMNNAVKGTITSSGTIDLGTVITSHQDISGKLDKSGGTMTGALTLSGDPSSNLHAATKKYVDDSITALPSPMIFKGSLGTGGTITTLPAASEDNEGYTYKVITAGTYASQAAKVGDMFISDGSAWVYIPSADEPSGTVTSVGLSVPTGLTVTDSPITTSGTLAVTFTSGYSIPTTAKQENWDTAYGWGNHASAGYTKLTIGTTATTAAAGNHTHSAYVNQNAFSNVKVGETTVAANSATDTIELVAGSNVTITPDATNDKITIAATDTTYESKAAAAGGTAVSLVTTGEKATWNAKTSNTGTVTSVAIKMNGAQVGNAITTSGTIDLGTVLTSSSTDTVPNVTAVGSATTASVSNGLLTITTGSAPTLGNAISVVTSVS